MIPHHKAASEMCSVWETQTPVREVAWNQTRNAGIASLCYNITFGAAKWGIYQSDFSQPAETQQMLTVTGMLGKTAQYENGCRDLTTCERNVAIDNADVLLRLTNTSSEEVLANLLPPAPYFSSSGNDNASSTSGASSASSMSFLTMHGDHKMFMGCGANLTLVMNTDSVAAPATTTSPHSMIIQYLHLNMWMHARMAFNWTGDADLDFLLGMLPHHQAAIAMCNIYYAHWRCAPARRVSMCSVESERSRAVGTLDMQNRVNRQDWSRIDVLPYTWSISVWTTY
ncbi:unnamed protein product [Amoebophrya sp. A25]|nr:unnamed protein product [Amoebophrya sp. A25]|eukprot:GSA25T00005904001.1